MFINFSNHPSAQWSAAQRAAAQRYGRVEDLAFPAIDPAADEAALDALADAYTTRILSLRPAAVLCQGESTFTYRVAQRLEQQSVPVVAACSAREVRETLAPDGSTLRQSVFVFAGFRRYGPP